MPKKLPMPPPGTSSGCTDCLQYDDTLIIEFVHPGYFGTSVSGLFDPDLPHNPTKLYAAGTEIGPFKPLPTQTTQVVLSFFDQSTQMLWLDTLTITSNCH
jgi:hypothetical protein